jgi:hypothetical protein
MKKFLLAPAALVALVGSASAQQPPSYASPPWSHVPGYSQAWLSPGWVYRPYLNCDEEYGCTVQDPTGTPLIIRSHGRNSPNIGTILNGTRVWIVNQMGSYVQIAINTTECHIAQDVNGSIYCGKEDEEADDHIACDACSVKHPAVLIGWMKSSDVGCSEVEGKSHCNALDHYTDAYQRGGTCATYGTPFYDRPNGKPIGLVWGEKEIFLGAKSKDGKYTRVWGSPADNGGIFPYSLKALRECG